MVTKKQIIGALKTCFDPEIHIDIVTLGLIYGVKITGNDISIQMTFTAMGCPYGEQLLEDVKKKVRGINGVKKVGVEVTFDPPWQPSKELLAMLGV